jgi:hypothetical protein
LEPFPPGVDRHAVVEVLEAQPAPGPLQSNATPLAVVQAAAQVDHLLPEQLPITQLTIVPPHIPEPLQDAHQLMVAELERRRGQEQHPVERAGHGPIPRAQVGFRFR